MQQPQLWRKPDGTRIKVPIEEEVRSVLVREKTAGHHLKVCIGTDSQVHADINTNPGFKSNAALSEAMGYIRGMGFAFRAKPHAFASSSCANKMVQ